MSQYKTWRTYQMSDHRPLWAEFRVDFSDDYLREARAPANREQVREARAF